MSGPLGDKQQKRGENVENIKSCLDTQLNFMFSTYSPLFCCLSTRGPDVSHPSLRFLYIFGDPGLLLILHSHVVSISTSKYADLYRTLSPFPIFFFLSLS